MSDFAYDSNPNSAAHATLQPSIEVPHQTNGSNTTSNANANLAGAKQTVVDNASAAINAVQNHPITQSVANGPVATNVKDQSLKTSAEFSNLAAARTTPHERTATGQQLTHYHSFFGSLLSWNNPRASGIAYLAIVSFIFAARYLNILRYGFKLTWMTLGVTVAAEVAGKSLFNQGLTSQIRPKKYYTVPKQTLDNILGDVHELINFFVIESQRIVFAENVFASVAAFFGAFISYYLIKIVPFWGMSLIATSVLFLSPLIYKTNQELIDHHVRNASNIVNQQTKQVKELASQQAARATEFTKQSVGDYSAKAQDLVASARGRSSSPVATTKSAKTDAFKSNNTSSLKNDNTSAFKTDSTNPFTTDNTAIKTDNTSAFKTDSTPAFKTETSPAFQTETIPTLKSEDFPAAVNAPLTTDSAFKHDDFPAAPKEDFKTVPIADEFVTKDFKAAENEPLFTS